MSAQKEFDATYVSSSEIAERLGVTRVAIIHARAKGQLPDAVMVGDHLTIWKRTDIEPHIKLWEKKRNARAGV